MENLNIGLVVCLHLPPFVLYVIQLPVRTMGLVRNLYCHILLACLYLQLFLQMRSILTAIL